MRASLATFCALDVPSKHVAVLGDMGELGSYAPACHAGIGEFAATLPLDRLVCVGELSLHIAGAASAPAWIPSASCARALFLKCSEIWTPASSPEAPCW
ncbi:MAG: hypothetical protein ACLSVD_09425 [Eggerthellaceae bacterium]